MAAHDYAAFSGDIATVALFWSDNDDAILSDNGAGAFNSLQFQAGLRYFNRSGNGLLHFDPSGKCGGSWACDGLVDWPVTTRDGYDVSPSNSDDTVRNALGALGYGAISSVATMLGKTDAAARYKAMQQSVLRSLVRLSLRRNATMAFFVDGAVGASASHAAVHSTLYAVSAGALDEAADPVLAGLVVAYLRAHGVPPSSCMMARWWTASLLHLGIVSADAADYALELLTKQDYPSFLDMMAQGATTTMEAWRPADKSNLDFAHPWCASPSFNVPGGVLGAAPEGPGWKTWRLVPQPSSVSSIDALVPSPQGMISVAYASSIGASQSNATVNFSILAGQDSVRVCLAVAGTAAQAAPFARPSSDVLVVDGAAVGTPQALGRFLCASVASVGKHVAQRITSV